MSLVVPDELESLLVSFPMFDRNGNQNQRDSLSKSLRLIRNWDNNGEFSPPADVLCAPKEYIFYIDVPGLSKSDIQVELEEENILVIKGGGKRKRDDEEGEDCKYLKLERRPHRKFLRKFSLPQDVDASAITAKCENGVLSVTVLRVTPPKPRTVQVAIS